MTPRLYWRRATRAAHQRWTPYPFGSLLAAFERRILIPLCLLWVVIGAIQIARILHSAYSIP